MKPDRAEIIEIIQKQQLAAHFSRLPRGCYFDRVRLIGATLRFTSPESLVKDFYSVEIVTLQ